MTQTFYTAYHVIYTLIGKIKPRDQTVNRKKCLNLSLILKELEQKKYIKINLQAFWLATSISDLS